MLCMEKPYPEKPLSIKAWAEADRPREKLALKGRKALSDAELLSILLGSGSRKESALGLARRILDSLDGDLSKLGRCSPGELRRFRGIGEAKAIGIVAALELGRRRQLTPAGERPQVRSSQDAYHVVAPLLADLPHEEFWILLLNRANRVIGREQISSGGVSGTVVDAKVLFRKAILGLASSVILCHNHPSGNLRPSQADIDLTAKLLEAGKTLDVVVLDHLILGGDLYFSFADEGKI